MTMDRDDADRLARGLGWFSIGLGLAELVAGRDMARSLGLPRRAGPPLLRAFGLREVAAGLGLLRTSRPGPWLWARVAGDALDLAALAPALRPGNRHRGRAAVVFAAVAGVTILDLALALRLDDGRPAPRALLRWR